MYEFTAYNEMNRFQNLDSIENKIVDCLVNDDNKHAENFWKLLKYSDLTALSHDDLKKEEKLALIYNDNGEPNDKRVFISPFMDDAWKEQCSSVYIFVEKIKPINHLESVVTVTIETVTHTKVAVINGDGDPDLNPNIVEDGRVTRYGANPNDSDVQGSVVVSMKNRETVLVKSILAALNGKYLDGIGYLRFDKVKDASESNSEVTMPLFNSRSFFGHSIKFAMSIAGDSMSGGIGY